MTLTSTGAFLIPASLPGTMVVDFIQAHKKEAYSALKDIDGYAFRHITHSLLLGLIHMLTNSTCNYDNSNTSENDDNVANNGDSSKMHTYTDHYMYV